MSFPKAPPPLTQEEKTRLTALWKTSHRSILDVKSHAEEKLVVGSHPTAFCQRLHGFLVDFLEQNMTLSPSSTNNNKNKNNNPFIKRFHASSLVEFYRLAVQQNNNSKGAATRGSTNNNHPQEQRPVQLAIGRRVISIPYAEFAQELNQYEQQSETVSSEFVLKNSFMAYLYHRSAEALAALGCAMALALTTVYIRQQQQQQQQGGAATVSPEHQTVVRQYMNGTQIVVRFLHVQPAVPLKDIKTGLVGKFLTVKGHVVKARTPRLRVATADFKCSKCGGDTVHAFCQGRYSTPSKCGATEGCKSRTFYMQRPTARYVNVQEWRLQEAPDEAMVQAGRTPRQIVLEMAADDLIQAARPGDLVLVACTVAAAPTTTSAVGRGGKRAQETSTYEMYLVGHSVTTLSGSRESNNRQQQRQRQQQDGTNSSTNSSKGVVYTQAQLEKITYLCHADHKYFGLIERRAFPFDLLVRSLCPSIIGHHEVKAGLLLCLLGGTPPQPSAGGEKENTIRSNSHILIVGDPGMGKSQMLLAVNQLAARSVYVGGNTSSTTGLTVTLTKEDRGETGIEAGALVLADQGVCCIDEFDKMAKKNQDGLLEAMEQQQVSIAKAGVVASLPARCSVIAAANPKHGSYNMGKTVAENLNMAKPILSRFDLVFILRDRADRDLDRMVSSNIMNLYRGQRVKATAAPGFPTAAETSHPASGGDDRLSLSDRLAWVADFQKDALPADLIRDYIAYAREYCKPKLTKEAAIVLKEYYMELRYPTDGSFRNRNDTVPITTRQLEALIRLCQARAKACLRDYCLKEDALDVVELMGRSVEQVHQDDNGVIDRQRGGAGGTSLRKLKKKFKNEVQRVIKVGNECSMDDLRRIAANIQYPLGDFLDLIDEMRTDSILLARPNGMYKVLS